MKKLLISIALLLFWATAGNAYTLVGNQGGPLGGAAYYDIYQHWYIDGSWVPGIDAYAGGGGRWEPWTVTSDYGGNGQVWAEVLIESVLTWEVANYEGLENLFYTGGYELDYYVGNNQNHQQMSLTGTLEFREGTGSLSLAYKQPILINIGEEYYTDVGMLLSTPIISADPWIGEPIYSATSGSGIWLTMDSQFTYILPNETPTPVTEPTTIILMGFGLVGLAGFGRKKFK